jgi:hypothetical protein
MSPPPHPAFQYSPSSSLHLSGALLLLRHHTYLTENHDTTTGSHQVRDRDRDRAEPESSSGRDVAVNLEDLHVSRSALWGSLSLRLSLS